MLQDHSPQNSTEIEGRDFAFRAGKLVSKPFLALFIVIAVFIIHSARNGLTDQNLLVILSAFMSFPILFMYPLLTSRNGDPPKRSLLGMIVGFGAFIPYILGCYMTFYEGLWRLRHLLQEFTFTTLLTSIAFVILGFSLVNGVYRVTELCYAVDKGKLIVRSSKTVRT